MSVASAVSIKVINLFFVMIMGIILRKLGVLDKGSTSTLSKILVNLTNPFLIICALQRPFDAELTRRGFAILALSVAVHLGFAIFAKLSYLGISDKTKEKVFRAATIFTNCGFLGFPVCEAMCSALGDENGLFYGVFFNVFFNIFVWTYGVVLVNGGARLTRDVLINKILLNPSFIATVVSLPLYLFSIKIPVFVFDGMNYIGNMTFPLSMIIVGSLFCELDLSQLFRDKSVYYFLFIRLLACPLIVLGLCKLFSLPVLYTYVVVALSCMPTASVTAIMADYYGKDSALSSKCVSFSTIVSVLTIPVVMMIAGMVL